MDDLLGELAKGIFRAVSYLVIEVLFHFVFYYIGWPICKIVTFGKYPNRSKSEFLDKTDQQQTWCGFIGFLVVLFVILYFLGLFG